MNKWFDEIFLNSLFNRTEIGKSLWLTRKQTAICVENMEVKTMNYKNKYGFNYNHLYYIYLWNDREVSLQYSKKNGCGSITFYSNEKEKELNEIESKKEKERIEENRIRLLKKNKERLNKEIKRLQERINILSLELKEDLELLLEGKEDAEWINKDIDWLNKEIEKDKEKLKKLSE